MCRHLAYSGPPAAIAQFALDAPHALVAQCERAREMTSGHQNLDGWGYAWRDERGCAHRYRSELPMTADDVGRDGLRDLRSSHFVVHVRQKSPGSATATTGSAPFWDGEQTFFTHNGMVKGFRDGVREELMELVSPARAARIEGDADSEVLFALVLDRLDLGDGTQEALAVIAEVARKWGGRYNVLLLRGPELVATRWGSTLYVRRGEGVTVASEPLDDGPWQAVPDQTLVTVRDGEVGHEQW